MTEPTSDKLKQKLEMCWNDTKESQKIKGNVLYTWATLGTLDTRIIVQCP